MAAYHGRMSPILFACLQQDYEKYLADQAAALLLRAETPQVFGALDKKDDGDSDECLEISIDGVAHVHINGVLSENGPSAFEKAFGLQGTSYKSIIQAVERAALNPAVQSLQLEISSPGGEVQGMDQAWQAIADFPKPKSTLNNGMMASAAYVLGTAVGPGKILASTAFDMTGAIGVMAACIVDAPEMATESGAKKYVFVSKNAPLKDADPASKAGAEGIQSQIDAIERLMLGRIAEGRGISPEYVAQWFGQGSVMVAFDPDSSKPSGLNVGMIDGVMGTGGRITKASGTPDLFPEQDGRQKPEEKIKMTLAEFLAQGPEARAELEAVKAEAFKAGAESYRQETKLPNA